MDAIMYMYMYQSIVFCKLYTNNWLIMLLDVWSGVLTCSFGFPRLLAHVSQCRHVLTCKFGFPKLLAHVCTRVLTCRFGFPKLLAHVCGRVLTCRFGFPKLLAHVSGCVLTCRFGFPKLLAHVRRRVLTCSFVLQLGVMLILCNGQCPQLFGVYYFRALCAVTEGANVGA
jgi:hypothetical protein